MDVKQWIDNCDIIQEVIASYMFYRKNCSVQEALNKITDEYKYELQDENDAVLVRAGIMLALNQLNEHTDETAHLLNIVISMLQKYIENDTCTNVDIENAIHSSTFNKQLKSGINTNEVTWEVGDTFALKLSPDVAVSLHMQCPYAIMRKVGDYTDYHGMLHQLVYISLCEEENIPKSREALSSLGVVRMMQHGQRWDYLAQVKFRNFKEEKSWNFIKLGTFMNMPVLSDATVENPVVTMPILSGKCSKVNKDLFEQALLHFFRFRGIGYAANI